MSNNKVTIIEDDPDLRTLMQMAVKRAGFDVTGYSSGNEVINDVNQTADLYVIDVNLGGISGLDLCKMIKEMSVKKAAPVVVIIVSANPDLKALALEACADDMLAKPFTTNDLIKKIAHYLPSSITGSIGYESLAC